MLWLALLLAALAPVAFMIHFVYVRDKYEREPVRKVLQVFFLSFLTVIPAIIAQLALMSGAAFGGLLGVAVMVWGIVALSEEGSKYFAVRLLAMRSKEFNEVYDGIIYAVAASLGFACIENLMYVFGATTESISAGFGVAAIRAVLSVPGHALWGVMMGYYLGQAKFEPDRGKRLGLIRRGLFTAVFWHGLFNFCVFGSQIVPDILAVVLMIGVVAVIISNWVIAMRMIRKAQAASTFKRPNPLLNPVEAVRPDVKYCHQCGALNKRTVRFCTACGYEFPPRTTATKQI
jgi:RsiW-degrading membrane proteinase PrsW (M82 family)